MPWQPGCSTQVGTTMSREIDMTWAVIKTRNDRTVERVVTRRTEKEAIETAIAWADEDGHIREDGEGDDFMASHSSWKRDELREQLETDGSYMDEEESLVTVMPTE
jgi:hypothetical protein